MEYRGQIYEPGGNTTALIMGTRRTTMEKTLINEHVMRYIPCVEQVGFVNEEKYELIMAGGEFCGNATRSAAYFYLNGNPGEIEISVSGVSKTLRAGVTKTGEAWAEMPVYKELSSVSMIDTGVYKVMLEGITHVVILPDVAEKYLFVTSDLKDAARKMIEEYGLLKEPAAGIIFVEKKGEDEYMIHPCVFVPAIETMFYETACGSGSTALGLVISQLKDANVEIDVLQPSLQTIRVTVNRTENEYISAFITGNVKEMHYIHWREAA